jgi:hypothetical protein
MAAQYVGRTLGLDHSEITLSRLEFGFGFFQWGVDSLRYAFSHCILHVSRYFLLSMEHRQLALPFVQLTVSGDNI